MSVIKCQDPRQYFREDGGTSEVAIGVNLTYPTNSFYPPGTICAREKNLKFCPTSGESGSPLMIEDDEGRLSVVGVNSFIKGCSTFFFETYSSSFSSFSSSSLTQFSGNPSVYSRLSCFLPWISEQYDMSYTASEKDERCDVGTGDINEVGGDQCRTTPTILYDIVDRKEALCIFPFYLDGKEYNQCTLTEIQDFTRPRFVCPIRTVRGKGNNYTADDVDRKYCPTNVIYTQYTGTSDIHTFNSSGEVVNPYNREWELDPENLDGCYADYGSGDPSGRNGRPVFATCKNTCPGGEMKLSITAL